ncbi:MAG: aminotransferase class I/II-fold pyridoxal phosphate-dependent enzyme [Pseudomonadota bacterium]
MMLATSKTVSPILSPWDAIRALLGDAPPGADPIDMTIGEPKHPMPDFVMARMAEAAHGFGQYPPIRGTDALRQAIADWAERRYAIALDPQRMVLALNGSREGLYSAVVPALERRPDIKAPLVAMPNPFYQVYSAAATSAGAEPYFLSALPETNFLPDLDALENDPATLKRLVAFYLCSPSNPQGTLADRAYLVRAIALARAYDFMLFCDECYSEIYDSVAPCGGLEVASHDTGTLDNVIAFNSLSKRSNLPGLRSGFCAGDPAFIERFATFRNVTCPQVPLPIQHASAAIWADEAHVVANRQRYVEKFDACDRLLGGLTGYQRPAGSFFLWLDMGQFGGGVAATVTLWKGCGVKVLPGAYLCHPSDDDVDPGADHIRIALVHDLAITEVALERLVSQLG